MGAYSEAYLEEVVENQGRLFGYVAEKFPDKDTEDFIHAYMVSRTRKYIDESQAYVNTMDARELWKYFMDNDNYHMKPGKVMTGFMPDWIGLGSFMRIISGIMIFLVQKSLKKYR